MKFDELSKEAREVQRHLGCFPWMTCRAIKSVTKELLLYGAFMFNGRSWTPLAKHLGAGVYEITLEQTKY